MLLPNVNLNSLRFAEPLYLWLLVVPAVLLVLWVWQLLRQRGDRQRFKQHRYLPVRERYPIFGGLLFWLCLIFAVASLIVALARPQALVSMVRNAGIDLVILQDGSASMYVKDVGTDRWQRSIRFLRVLGESMSWTEDRIAMALFAHIATPQIRLTKDPNTFFFFLDHLDKVSPFRLEDDTTWDTNIEMGLYWGLRLVEKDEEIHGKSPNAKAFILISDGQDWSGDVQDALEKARSKGIPVYVVGVGTTSGGIIPEPPRPGQQLLGQEQGPVYSALDRASLSRISTAGGGQYSEMDREGDREIALSIISATRSRAGSRGDQESVDELYWRFLAAAAVFACLGVFFLRERAELWLQVAGAGVAMAVIIRLLR